MNNLIFADKENYLKIKKNCQLMFFLSFLVEEQENKN